MARPRDPNTKVNLLRAAEEVFIQHGLDEARVEDITSRAGVSKGAFYLHFETKEAAFEQIVETFLARLATCIAFTPAPVVEADRSALDAIVAEALNRDVELFEFLWHNRHLVRMILTGAGSMRFNYLVDGIAARARDHVRELLKWGQCCGLYRDDLDIELASLVVAGGYDRVAREMVSLPARPDLRIWVGETLRMVVRSIGTPLHIEIVDRLVTNPDAPSRQLGLLHAH